MDVSAELTAALRAAIKDMVEGKDIAVAFSGGLDSGIVAAIAKEYVEDKKRADLIVCDTIKLAKKLGMQIVAEGIETREQVDFLAQQHCDLIQGFYFAKPLPIEEFEEKAFTANN